MGLPVFLADFGGDLPAPGARVTVEGPEAKHMAVRRLPAGAEVLLVDGEDRRARARISLSDGPSRVECEILDSGIVPRPAPHVTVVQAIPKSDRAELAVDLMTEAGVDAIVPWAARNCVAKWAGAKAGKARAKWQSAAREAAKQARRAWVPPVAEQHTTGQVTELIRQVVGRGGVAAVLHEAETRPFADVARAAADSGAGDILFIVGPEGGVDDAEVAEFLGAGATAVVLGPTVLRTALAGAAATAALGPLTARWG